MSFREELFGVSDDRDFEKLAIRMFHSQLEQDQVYSRFVAALSVNPASVKQLADIPFIPVSFFKTQEIILSGKDPELVFLSSGTTGMERSRHLVADAGIYRQSLLKGFRHFYGDPAGYIFFALVPDPVKNPASSLSYMLNHLMELSEQGEKFFSMEDLPALNDQIIKYRSSDKKRLLVGLTSSLLDFSARFPARDPGLIVMETGGMKGKGKELVREELHSMLSEQFGTPEIHSEYGMTELLSQAYSKKNGLFSSPPWMRILIRDMNDPFDYLKPGRTGGINVIDLANFNSCPFIATQDLGRLYENGRFEVLGRFDSSEARGCNLMAL